jgi:lipoic acid synthetase
LKKPDWLKIKSIKDPNQDTVAEVLKKLNLKTVCNEAICPNHMECFSRKTATFMILGVNCTRDCRFCNVRHESPQPVDPGEPERIAFAVNELEMRYIVITSVTRDDLSDGGAEHFAKTIRAIRDKSPKTAVEVLIPDFKGDFSALQTVAEAMPDVIGHNMETVEQLYPQVRPQANYRRSLELIKNIKKLNPAIRSKSGIMLGLGETKAQVHKLFNDLREADCEFLTIGQYLAPSPKHLPIKKYIEPAQFDEYGKTAKQRGFSFVASAPLVRSSYHADEALVPSGLLSS